MNCKLCSSNEIVLKYTIHRNDSSFLIYECLNCCFQFQNIPEKEAYRFYDEGYYTGQSSYNYLDERQIEEASRIVWNKRLRKLKKWERSDNSKNFLDIGCSFGGLMQSAKENGYAPYGIEVSQYSGEYAKNRHGGDRVFVGNCETISLPRNFFSIVTVIEVIEHLYQPRKALENVLQSMRKGGLLLIQTADMQGLQALIKRDKYNYYMEGHLSYFSKTNLLILLKEIGFSKVKFIGGVEFGLIPKLRKSRYSFKKITDYGNWLRITFYHFLSKINLFGLHFTSSMVILAWK